MFNVGASELLVILLVALIVLGPERLPDAARKMGNIAAELRRMSQGFQREVRDAFDEATAELPPQPPAPAPRLEAVAEEHDDSDDSDESDDPGDSAEPGVAHDDPAA